MICLALLGAGAPLAAYAQAGAAPAAAGGDDAAGDRDIIVTGRRAALQSADDRKKNAAMITDSVVADEAGKLPDNSITEVLQRVSGVTIVRFSALNDPDHFSVEGSGIQVRGLSGVASRLNGREIFSANAGRSLLWGDVTPELMSAVDVYKSSSADQIEGGTGGSVDLRTKLPFDYDYGWHFAGSADVSKGDLAKETDYSMSGLIAGKFDTGIGKIGILVDGAYSQLTSNSHFYRMEPYFRTAISGKDYFIPGGYDLGEQLFQRKRDGLYAAVQWAPSDSLKLTGIFFQSRYRGEGDEWAAFVTSQSLAVDPATSKFDANGGLLSSPSVFQRDAGSFLPNGNPINEGETTGVNRTRSLTQDMSLAADFTPEGSHFSAHASFQRVVSKSRANSLSLFGGFNFPTSFGLDLTGPLPVITTPSSFAASNFADPARYQWSAAMPHDEDNRGAMNTGSLDLEYSFDEGFFKSVKAGGRWSRRTERDFNNSYAWSPLGRGWNGDPQLTFANAAPGDVEAHPFDNFFHGAGTTPGTLLFPSYALTSLLDTNLVHKAPPAGFCGAPFATASWWDCSPSGALTSTGYGGAPGRPTGFILPIDQADMSTRTLAGYVMANFGGPLGSGELSGNIGVRVVNLKNFSQGYLIANASTFTYNNAIYSTPNGSVFHSGSAEFTRVLPAINLTFSPNDKIKLRAAYNITMDLPSFQALNSSGDLGVTTTSNPASTPTNPLPGIFTGFTSRTGDPTLKPAMANNFDLALEWYPKAGTKFHISAFYKRITDLLVYSADITPISITLADGTALNGLATTNNAHNAPAAATVKGVEIGGRTFFDQLPGLLKGFGVEGNFTYIDSKSPGDTYFDIYGIQRNDAPLQGLSKYNYNIALLYERDPLSIRVAYSWRSRYLQTTNANGTNPTYSYIAAPGATGLGTAINLPVYGDNVGTLDAGVTFKVNSHVSLSVQGTNLTNTTTKTRMGGYPNNTSYIRSWFQNDRRVTAGLNVSF